MTSMGKVNAFIGNLFTGIGSHIIGFNLGYSLWFGLGIYFCLVGVAHLIRGNEPDHKRSDK